MFRREIFLYILISEWNYSLNMLPIILFTALVGAVLSSPSSNQYVDNVLHTTLQNVIQNERVDPTHLPDYTFEYSDKTFFGKVHGKAEYTEGFLKGLSQVTRASECQGPFNISTNTVINCTLSFNYLTTGYKGKVKYGVLPKVNIDAKADVKPTLVTVGIAKAFSSNLPQVKSFGLHQVGQLLPKFTGLGPLNKQLGVLEDNYKSRISFEVYNVILNRFQYALNLAVGQVPMPLR